MPSGWEEDYQRNNAFSLYDLYGHTVAQESLPRGHEIYNLLHPSSVIIIIYSVCFIYPQSREKFERNT